ncbi:helix-turn-helix domain-containing protein [Apilactobacillus apisilvae]|uniref:Helix-turn-helix domain-containing protein n=1 Tax=Apilactobacillus apisilvae TaxID=2923364 RepID=A0ABY4PFV8_9LACO|nr:helix-turn-helix transcriptional regulator [Apilactobacillus apisilvae]UQS84584.1 helix-turn-helix domain-containing protein [Apilactobacillus apisilvae]
MQLIGQKLRIIRYSKDLKISEVADLTDLTVKEIEQIESGYILPDTVKLDQFSRAYDVPLENLIPKQKLQSQLLWYTIGGILIILFYLVNILYGNNFNSSDIFLTMFTIQLMGMMVKINKITSRLNIHNPILFFIEKHTNKTVTKIITYLFFIISAITILIYWIKSIMAEPIICSSLLVFLVIILTIAYFTNKKRLR